MESNTNKAKTIHQEVFCKVFWKFDNVELQISDDVKFYDYSLTLENQKQFKLIFHVF